MLKKCLKTLFIYTLCISLLEVGVPVIFPALGHVISSVSADDDVPTEAPSSEIERSFEGSLSFYRNVSLAQNPKSFFELEADSETQKSVGETVLDWTQDFINNDLNEDALNTPEGKELLAYHNKFVTYQDTKKRLEACMEDARDKFNNRIFGSRDDDNYNNVEKYANDIEKRILGGVLAADKSSFDCHRALTEKTSLDELFAATLQATDLIEQSAFQEEIYNNSFKKMIQAWLNTKFTYDKEYATGGNLTADEKAEMQVALCNEGGCTPKQSEMIDSTGQAVATLLHDSEMTRYSPEEAQSDINNRINTLNDLVEGRELDTRRAWLKLGLGRTVDRDGEGTLETVQFYQEEYLKLSTSGAGSLMWTDSIQDKSGAMKGVRDWDWDGDNARLGDHSAVSKSDVESGIIDVLRNIQEQAKKINEQEKFRDEGPKEGGAMGHLDNNYQGRLNDHLEEYVSLNPGIVGASLAKRPQNVNKVCSAIHENISNGRAQNRFNNAVMGVTVAAAGLLIVSGVGSVFGVGLLSTTAISTTTMLGAGLAIGAVDVAHTGNQYYQAGLQKQAIMNTYFSGLGDGYTLIEAKDALDNYESAQTNFYWALGFTALDAITLKATWVARASPALLEKAAEVYSRFSNTRLGGLLSRSLRGASNLTKAGYRRVIDRIAHSSMSGRVLDMLENMNDSAFKRFMDRLVGLNRGLCAPGEASCKAFDDIIEEVSERNTLVYTQDEWSAMVRNVEGSPAGVMTDAPAGPVNPGVPVGEEFVDSANGLRTTIFDPDAAAIRPDLPDADGLRDITPNIDTTPAARPEAASSPTPTTPEVPRLASVVDEVTESAPRVDTSSPVAPSAPEILDPIPPNRAVVPANEVLPDVARAVEAPTAPVVPTEPIRPGNSLVLHTQAPVPRVQSTALTTIQQPSLSSLPDSPRLNTIIVPERRALPAPREVPRLVAPDVPSLRAPTVASTVNDAATVTTRSGIVARIRARFTPTLNKLAVVASNVGRTLQTSAELAAGDESEALVTGEDVEQIQDDAETTDGAEDDVVTDDLLSGEEQCNDNQTYIEEDNLCVENCPDGEVEFEEDGEYLCVPEDVEEQQQAPQGFFPQMIQRGLRIMGGLW